VITVYKQVREGTVWFKSGHFYTIAYTNFENDPMPTGVMLNYIKGAHPKTGNYHNYIQMINMNYVPRNYRKKFVNDWKQTLINNKGDVLLTWKKIRSRFPYLQFALRRYFVGKNYIRNQREVINEDLEKVVVSSYTRDYSLTAFKQALRIKAGPKGSKRRTNLSNRPSSRNKWFGAPV